MILYQVYSGVIIPRSVVRETKHGWREYDGGFTNRNTPSSRFGPSLSDRYYTTDIEEAKQWSMDTQRKLSEALQAAKASVCDIQLWEENGGHEEDLPKSRIHGM